MPRVDEGPYCRQRRGASVVNNSGLHCRQTLCRRCSTQYAGNHPSLASALCMCIVIGLCFHKKCRLSLPFRTTRGRYRLISTGTPTGVCLWFVPWGTFVVAADTLQNILSPKRTLNSGSAHEISRNILLLISDRRVSTHYLSFLIGLLFKVAHQRNAPANNGEVD